MSKAVERRGLDIDTETNETIGLLEIGDYVLHPQFVYPSSGSIYEWYFFLGFGR